MVKYVLHPGFVYSKTDGDRHYISADKLIRLYKVRPNNCVLHREHSHFEGMKGMIHLFPRYDGNYEVPNGIQN